MAQNHGLRIDWLNRRSFVSKTGLTINSLEFLAGLDLKIKPLFVYPGKQGRLFFLFSRASALNTLDDSLVIYPLRYRPTYLSSPVDE
jgi:hypothetical protein